MTIVYFGLDNVTMFVRVFGIDPRCGQHYPNRLFPLPLDHIKHTSLIHGRYPSFITLHVMPTPFGNLQP